VLTLSESVCLAVVERRRFFKRERERVSFGSGGGGRDTGDPGLEEKCKGGRKKEEEVGEELLLIELSGVWGQLAESGRARARG
jgi:hypothetical protein